MPVVVRLVKYSNPETLAVLLELVGIAVRGETSVALCFMPKQGGAERCVVTGAYKANPALGVNAAMRMALRLAKMQDEMG